MFIKPNWPAPKHIKTLCTTRKGGGKKGVSLPPFDDFNLALHVGDLPEQVEKNRQHLIIEANLPSTPCWLDQQHTDTAIEIPQENKRFKSESKKIPPPVPTPIADASWTIQQGCVSVVMTADCLPLLITNQQGSFVSAIHAGWKGLQKGIVRKTIQTISKQVEACSPKELLVWIGPAIQQKYFEVGQDVLDLFLENDPLNKAFFTQIATGGGEKSQKYLANLVGLVTKELNELGITAVFGGDLCSYSQTELFYSYRRSGQTGRMACLIWIE